MLSIQPDRKLIANGRVRVGVGASVNCGDTRSLAPAAGEWQENPA